MGTDFLKAWANQRAKARELYGSFTDSSGVVYPRMSGAYGKALLDYWNSAGDRAIDKYKRDVLQAGVFSDVRLPSDFVTKLGQLKNYINLHGKTVESAGTQWVNNGISKQIWLLTNAVMLPLNGILDTPSPWQYGTAALAESSKEFAQVVRDLPGNVWDAVMPKWLMPALLLVGGVWVYNNFLRKRDN